MRECDHFDKDHHPVMWNEFNKVVQCHKCGEQFVPISHASRDPEVADLKKDLSLNASLLAKQCDLAREAEGEVEKLKSYTKEKFVCPCGETTYLLEQNPNHFVGCISHNATPGHSPEGKTL